MDEQVVNENEGFDEDLSLESKECYVNVPEQSTTGRPRRVNTGVEIEHFEPKFGQKSFFQNH